jgi:MFS family permease
LISNRKFSLTIIIICEVAVLGLWFSATAILPGLRDEGNISSLTASLFTSAVQIGFVVGSLVSAFSGLADRIDPRKLFMVAALLGACANAGILLVDLNSGWVILFRFITGICMAGVYPIGMRLAATWARKDMGLMIGLLVGALTLGSASPYLFNVFGGVDWKFTLILASFGAMTSAILINFAVIGPNYKKAPAFKPVQALQSWTRPALRYANIGYLGHMWELYAMWAWIGVFLSESFLISYSDRGLAQTHAAFATFLTIGVGTIGCVAGGIYADRFGRTTLTIIAMAVSGLCALVVGHLFGGDPVIVVVVCLIWGFSIVADSPQFSASIAELAEPSLVGTMLTIQTSMGFLLTLLTIHAMPYAVTAVGWSGAFSMLAIGPLIGVYAMWRLRRHPESIKLANGKR